ncbi:hypothetical protein FRC07_004619 [Ceratobasidium sp. 392]|nr:hypothetical protein FRC07_004619 [Ceratobasidium sp. 392]
MHATDHVAPPGDDYCACSDDDHDVCDAESAVLAAQQRLDRLRSREHAKARAAREANFRLQPLPSELVLHVARIVAAENPRAVTRIAAVCTSFRDVVYASPELWQRISITQRDMNPDDIARAYVARSARRPLDVELRLFAADDPATRGPDDAERELATVLERLAEARDLLGRARSHPAANEWSPVLEATLQELIAFKTRATASTDWEIAFDNCLQILFAESPRLVRFEFRSTRRKPTELVAHYVQAANTPLLRELVLHLDPACRFGPLAPRHAPALVSADLQGVLPDPAPAFTGLRNLSLVNGTFSAPATALAPLLALLRANPDLEDLRLQPLIPPAFPTLASLTTSPAALVSLPRLSRLHLIHNSRLDRFLMQLRLPALTNLTLAIQTGSPGPLLCPIFQGVPYPELHTLRLVNLYIRAPAHERDLTTTLKQLATLRTLTISESTLCESMLRALADPTCCPLLEELLFERCEGIAQDAVLDIWAKRGAGPTTIRTGRGTTRPTTRRSTFQTPLNGANDDGDVRMGGTLRWLVVRNSSTPLADMQLGERVRS